MIQGWRCGLAVTIAVVLGGSKLIENAGSSSGDICDGNGLQFPRLGPTLLDSSVEQVEHLIRDTAENHEKL